MGKDTTPDFSRRSNFRQHELPEWSKQMEENRQSQEILNDKLQTLSTKYTERLKK